LSLELLVRGFAVSAQRLLRGLARQRQERTDGSGQVLAGGLPHEIQILRERREAIRVAKQHVHLAADLLDLHLHVDGQLGLAHRSRPWRFARPLFTLSWLLRPVSHWFRPSRDRLRLPARITLPMVPPVFVPEQPRAERDEQPRPAGAE